MKLVFDPKVGEYVIDQTIKPATQPKADDMELEQSATGFLSGIARSKVFDLDLGAAAVGAAGGVLIDRLIMERFMPGGWGAVGNLAVAWAAAKFLPRFLGKPAANAISFALTYEAIADTVQGWVEGFLPGGGTMPAQQSPGFQQSRGSGSYSQKGAVTDDYYNFALARA